MRFETKFSGASQINYAGTSVLGLSSRQIKVLHYTDAKIKKISIIIIQYSCLLTCNYAHNGVIHTEVLKLQLKWYKQYGKILLSHVYIVILPTPKKKAKDVKVFRRKKRLDQQGDEEKECSVYCDWDEIYYIKCILPAELISQGDCNQSKMFSCFSVWSCLMDGEKRPKKYLGQAVTSHAILFFRWIVKWIHTFLWCRNQKK